MSTAKITKIPGFASTPVHFLCVSASKKTLRDPPSAAFPNRRALFDKGIDPTKGSSTKKAKINYSDKPKEFTTGFFNNSTVRSNVKFKMPTKAESTR